MTARDHKLYIRDILDSIEKIESYTRHLSFEEFCKNSIVIDAVIRNFEIIGEASKNVPASIRSLHKDIPWKEMGGMRNKVIHQYFGVDLAIVWSTVKQALPNLRKTLKRIK